SFSSVRSNRERLRKAWTSVRMAPVRGKTKCPALSSSTRFLNDIQTLRPLTPAPHLDPRVGGSRASIATSQGRRPTWSSRPTGDAPWSRTTLAGFAALRLPARPARPSHSAGAAGPLPPPPPTPLRHLTPPPPPPLP